MSIIELPSAFSPEVAEWGLRANTSVFFSELDGSVQTLELPGARWTYMLRLPTVTRDTSAMMESFLVQLRGQANRARVRTPRRTPRGAWGGSPVVNGGSQTGSSLVCGGFTAATTIKQGDYFNVGTNGELKMVTQDTTANGSGVATISFEPALRASPSNGTALVFIQPVCPMMILSNAHQSWTIEPYVSKFAIDFVEVFQ